MKMEFTDMKEIIRHKIKHNLKRIETSIKWVLFAIISGVVAGGAGTLFYFGMTLVTLIRTKHPWLIFLLPFSGRLSSEWIAEITRLVPVSCSS